MRPNHIPRRFKNVAIIGTGILFSGLILSGPATANEDEEEFVTEYVEVLEEELAVEVLDWEVAGESLSEAENKTETPSN